jgi:outer membrane protein with beta-barrel domain
MRAATRCFASVAVLVFSGPGAVAAQAAQAKPTAEIGTSVGVTIVSQTGTPTDTHIGIPGGVGPLSTFSPLLYASFFASPSLMVEPQVSFSSTSGGGTTVTFFLIALQVAQLFTPNEKGSAYVAANGAFQTFSPGGTATSLTGPGVGGELGYRFKVKNSLAIRLNARYRRWFLDFKNVNEIGFGLGLGAIF